MVYIYEISQFEFSEIEEYKIEIDRTIRNKKHRLSTWCNILYIAHNKTDCKNSGQKKRSQKVNPSTCAFLRRKSCKKKKKL
jgi:hypothetical protein